MRVHSITVVASLAAASLSAAQTGRYFVTTGDQRKVTVLQHEAVTDQWDLVENEYAIALPPGAGEVRTVGFKPGLPGRTYDYQGHVIGGVLRHNLAGRYYDSTSDGTHNYLVNYNQREVYATDLDFENETFLFLASAGRGLHPVGITYDPATDTLWISADDSDFVVNYTLDGQVIRAFTTGHNQNTALALDPADGTLWLCANSVPGTIEQWHPSGARLFSDVIPGFETLGGSGGEFATCYADFDGSGDLNLFDFLGFTNKFNAADAQADCDGDGDFTLFDFLCFTNAFNAGC